MTASTAVPLHGGRPTDPSISSTPEWQALVDHHAAGPRRCTCASCSPTSPHRGETMTLEVGDLYLDYSKHRLTGETIGLLAALARRAGVEALRDAMFAGEQDQRDRAASRAARRPAGAGRRR